MLKTTVWPYVHMFYFSNGSKTYLHTSSMQDSLRNIHTKYGSNWSNSIEEKSFEKLLTTTTDAKWRQYLKLAFRQVS